MIKWIVRQREKILALLITTIVLSSLAYFLFGQYEDLNGFYFLIDDTWIHLRFAKNLADGYGFSFNPGHPIAASTAPLWTILLAFSYKLSGSLIFSAYFWGVTFFSVTCFLVYKLVFLISKNFLLAAVSTIVTALCPWLTWSALSGMEIMFSATLLLSAIYFYIRFLHNTNWKKYLGVFCAGLTTLTRPETYVLFPALVIHRFTLCLFSKKGNFKQTFFFWLPVALAIFVVTILPYGFFSLKTSGSFFPNTYSAKVGNLGLLGAIKEGSKSAFETVFFLYPKLYFSDFIQALSEINPLLTIALPFGLLGLLQLETVVLPLFLILFPLFVGLIIPTDRISWPWNRHMLNLIPVVIVVSLVGSYFLSKRILVKVKRCAVHIPTILFSLLTIVVIVVSIADQKKVRKYFIDRGAAIKTEHIAVANWINRNLPLQATIAASDIGVIGFYTERFIIDTEGLITPDILGKERRNSPAKDWEVYEYLQKTRPDYLVKFSWVYPTFPTEEFPLIHKSGNLAVYKTPWTQF